ncbi:hypothetical protein [Mesobacillus jeotgali]|uniref:hypothetical protein n=1 Tax=Mesobacillus jeotgali TaxID=129985 RepID=UPI0017805B78|nr:hypothetical protein [Mesobacillus jeotgali]UYZ22030.1 hypothetical protein FOF60_24120 [Mesobacillus jeotgali]
MSDRERLTNKELHTAFINALGEKVIDYTDLDQKPLEIDCKMPLPRYIRLYLYNLTHPPGGRTMGEHKIQLIIPGQGRGERASFDSSGGRIVIVAGYHSELDVFCIWDSGMYPNFSYSRNIQVRAETVYEAFAGKVAQQERRIRGQGTEIVITSPSNKLSEALMLRMQITRQRLIGGLV